MPDIYATRHDVFDFGLPRGALGSTAREFAKVEAATDTFELGNHGFDTNDRVAVRALEGGTLAAPLVAGVSYYVIRVDDDHFKLAAAPDGLPIDLTSDGNAMAIGYELPIDRILEFYSRFVDPFIPAHAAPLKAPYPIVVTAIVAELTAKKLQNLSGAKSVSVDDAEIAAKAQLQRWATGIPLRDEAATAPTNLAVRASLSETDLDPRGWGSRCIP